MDDKNKKIENYFHKKLQDFSESDDGWNIPPEDIWENAIASFPHRKKKKRFLAWWFMGVIVLLGFSYLVMDSYNSNDLQNDLYASNETRLAKSNNNNNNNNNNNTSATTVEEIKNNTASQETINNNSMENSIASKTAFITKSNAKKPLISNPNYTFGKSSSSLLKTKSNNLEGNLLSRNNTFQNYESSSNSKGYNKAHRSNNNNNNNNTNAFTSSSISKAIGSSSPRHATITIELLPRISRFLTSENSFSLDQYNKRSPIYKNPLPKVRKWEIGMSYMAFYIAKNTIFNTENGENDLFTLAYSNINLHLNHRLSKHWGLNSGLNHSSIGINAQFHSQIPFFNTNSHLNLRSPISNLGIGSINLDDDSEPIILEYLPGISIEEGALVDFNLDFNMQLRIVELPIELNYRIIYGRWGFDIGGGISLEYTFWKINPNAINIYQNDVLINKPIFTTVATDHEFAWGYSTRIGTTYDITNRFNIGTYLRIDPLDTDLLRLGIGLNYKL